MASMTVGPLDEDSELVLQMALAWGAMSAALLAQGSVLQMALAWVALMGQKSAPATASTSVVPSDPAWGKASEKKWAARHPAYDRSH